MCLKAEKPAFGLRSLIALTVRDAGAAAVVDAWYAAGVACAGGCRGGGCAFGGLCCFLHAHLMGKQKGADLRWLLVPIRWSMEGVDLEIARLLSAPTTGIWNSTCLQV